MAKVFLKEGPDEYAEIDVIGVETSVGPHPWRSKGWRYWICAHCYAPKALHPRTGWYRARPLNDNRHLSTKAPHFKEGW